MGPVGLDRINAKFIDKKTIMTKDELIMYLIEEAEYPVWKVNNMTNRELLDAYLKYNGIIGFTDEILNLIEDIYGIELF